MLCVKTRFLIGLESWPFQYKHTYSHPSIIEYDDLFMDRKNIINKRIHIFWYIDNADHFKIIKEIATYEQNLFKM